MMKSEWGEIEQSWNDDVSFVNRHEASSRIVDYSDRIALNTEMRFDVIDSLSFEIPEKDCGYFAVTTKAISLLDVVNYIETKKGSIDNAILFFYTVNDKAARYTAALSERANLKVVISDLMNSQRQKERVITDILDKANVEIVFCHNHAKIAAIKIGDNHFVLSGSMNAGNNARIESLQVVNSKKHFDFVLKLYEKMKDEYQIKKRY